MGSYKGYRDNAARVMAAAAEIVRRVRQPGCDVNQLKTEYRCGYPTLMKAIFSQISKHQWKAIAKKKHAAAGVKNGFQKGRKTWNKGRTGVSFPGSEKTQFKKGHLPHNHRHIGSTRINTRTHQGNTVTFKVIKVCGIMQGRHKWISYAKYLWQQKHGPVPDGHLIVHIDGDSLNDSMENLKLVNRKGHMALQMARDPNMLKRCRENSAKATKKRHAKNRKLKAKLAGRAEKQKAKQLQGVRLEKDIELKTKPVMEAGLTELSGAETVWFECVGCGFEYRNHPKGICEKCGGFRFEEIKQRLAKKARNICGSENYKQCG